MNNELVRHLLATIKYRFEKSIFDREREFAKFALGKGSRTPVQIVNHMYAVLHFMRIFLEEGDFEVKGPTQLSMKREINRFRNELKRVDGLLAVQPLPDMAAKKLIQGPLADILTHIGQIAMMQRLNGRPIEAEDFSKASIEARRL